MYKIEGNRTTVNLVQGDIEKQPTDAIVNWIYSDMISGPPSFYAIHRAAGTQLGDHTLSYEVGVNNKNAGDCFITQAGMLPTNMILHSMIDPQANVFHENYANIIRTLETYMEDNKLRTLSIYIPGNFKEHMKGIIWLCSYKLESITIMYKTQHEFDMLHSYLVELRPTMTIIERINQKADDFMSWFGKLDFKKKA